MASYVEMWIAKLAYKVEGGHIDQYTADNYTSSARSKLAETPLGAMRLTDVDADDIENHYAYLLRSGGHNGKPLTQERQEHRLDHLDGVPIGEAGRRSWPTPAPMSMPR